MHKYHAKPVVIDGIRFQSTAEGYRYKTLKLLERDGKIQKLVLQPKYELMSSYTYYGKEIQAITYSPDFKYYANGEEVIEDVKGTETETWKIKAKLFVKRFLGCSGCESEAKFYIIKRGVRHEWGEKKPRKRRRLK